MRENEGGTYWAVTLYRFDDASDCFFRKCDVKWVSIRKDGTPHRSHRNCMLLEAKTVMARRERSGQAMETAHSQKASWNTLIVAAWDRRTVVRNSKKKNEKPTGGGSFGGRKPKQIDEGVLDDVGLPQKWLEGRASGLLHYMRLYDDQKRLRSLQENSTSNHSI